jgi:pimeloyl-ACP methyl ester carboxylesterase
MRILLFLLFPLLASAQQTISIPASDGVPVAADQYGRGDRGVVLAHGGRFTKESWAPQARQLVDAGFRVVSIEYRKDDSKCVLDVLAAIHYLRSTGARQVSVVGGSMGGDYAAEAAEAEPAAMDRLVLLAAGMYTTITKMKGPKLFIVAKNDTEGPELRLTSIRERFDQAPPPKQLIILDGNAHAQFLFATPQGERVMREILRFLTAP